MSGLYYCLYSRRVIGNGIITDMKNHSCHNFMPEHPIGCEQDICSNCEYHTFEGSWKEIKYKENGWKIGIYKTKVKKTPVKKPVPVLDRFADLDHS